jgi:signal transduction histidine kinase
MAQWLPFAGGGPRGALCVPAASREQSPTVKWHVIRGSRPHTEADSAASPGVPGPAQIGLAAACTGVGLALGGRALWLIVLAEVIPLNRGLVYAGQMAAAGVLLVAAARLLLGAVQPVADVAPTKRSVWLRTAVSSGALLVGLAALGALTYGLGRHLVEDAVRKRLEAVATLNTTLIESWAEKTRNDIDIWRRGPIMGEVLQPTAKGDAAAVKAAQIAGARRVARTWKYSALTLRDPATGARLFSTSDLPDSLGDRRLAAAVEASADDSGRPRIDLAHSTEPAGSDLRLTFFRMVPLEGEARRAVLQVDIDADQTPLRRALPATPEARTIELLLVQRNKNGVEVVSDSRRLTSRWPLLLAADARSIWAALARQGDGGHARGSNATGQATLAYARTVARTRWLMTALIEEEAVLGELNRVCLLAAAMADAMLVIGVWWWMLYRREAARERRLQSERTRHAEALAELAKRVVSTQEQERNRLAMELHDRTAANLATINLILKCIPRAPEVAGQDGPDLLQECHVLLADTIVSIREFCADLRPALLGYAGLPAALGAAAVQFEARTGIRTVFEAHDFTVRCHADLESVLFRIVQEALLNCAKHSGASQVRIALSIRSSRLELEVEDNGSGFDPQSLGRSPQGVGHGLLNMRDRAAFAGGVLRVDSRPGGGTQISFAMHLAPPQVRD